MEDVIIIGAGLSGLNLAAQLKSENISVKIIEAQERLGGRIHTIYGNAETPMELGATWFNMQHSSLLNLLKQLKLDYFFQYSDGISLYETEESISPQKYRIPSYTPPTLRVKGGTTQLIEALRQLVGDENIIRQSAIIQIIDEGDYITLIDNLGTRYHSQRVVISIPPKLLIHTVQFTPALTPSIMQMMAATQTWMSGAAKFAVEYSSPFWREKGYSGTVYSYWDMASEIYDHSNYENSKFALMGFLNPSAIEYDFAERKSKLIQQLTRYFGEESQNYLSYNDKIWNDKFISTPDETFQPFHREIKHSLSEESYMNDKLFFMGTETSHIHNGYLEGAVYASNKLSQKLIAKSQKKIDKALHLFSNPKS